MNKWFDTIVMNLAARENLHPKQPDELVRFFEEHEEKIDQYTDLIEMLIQAVIKYESDS